MKYWGKMGAFWGGFWGLLFGSAMFAIPGIGPLLVAGPLVAWIVGALEGATVVGGVSAVGAGLFSIGIPKDSVVKYEVALKTDKFLLVVHGTPEAVEHAKHIIEGTEHHSYSVHEELVPYAGISYSEMSTQKLISDTPSNHSGNVLHQKAPTNPEEHPIRDPAALKVLV